MHLGRMGDHRSRKRLRHPLPAILALSVAAMLAGEGLVLAQEGVRTEEKGAELSAAPQVMAPLRNVLLGMLQRAGAANTAAAPREVAWTQDAALRFLGLPAPQRYRKALQNQQ